VVAVAVAAIAVLIGVVAVIADRLPRVDDVCVDILPSGLTVATERVPGARSAAIGVWVGVGARDEPAELAGVSHFLEHLLFKGTPDRTAHSISQVVDRCGGDINAFTSKEYTAYYCRLPVRDTSAGIELLGDVLTQPLLADDDVESERRVILEELAMDDDSPEDVAHRHLAAQIFPGHSLGRETAGERETVRAIMPDDVRRFFAERYRSESTVVAVAGDVDVDAVRAEVERAFAAMPRGDGRVAREAPGHVEGDLDLDDDTEQVHLLVGGRSLHRTDPDREALDVVNHVLGGGLSSRLFEEIRERRGLAYSVYSATASYADAGAWSVYAGTQPEHAPTVLSLVQAELERLCADGITADELDIAVGYLTGSYELGLEDTGARMSRLGAMLVTLGHVRPVDEQLDRWRRVSRADVDRVIARVFGAAPRVTVTLGPG
jgi:predicted Zn-dependent peptidase